MISPTFVDTVSRLAKRLTGIALLIALGQAAWAAKPNIVFILADDMGSGDVQAINPQSKVPTPNLNRLAKQGMTFTDAHSPSAVCTPTTDALRCAYRSLLLALETQARHHQLLRRTVA